MHTLLRLIPALAVLCCSPGFSASLPVASHFQPVHQLLTDHVERGQLAGAAGLVLHEGEVVYSGAVGLRDREANQPMTVDTIFRIASMTKPITSAAIMMLVEEGRLEVSDPLAKHLPEFANAVVLVESSPDGTHRTMPARREITIHDLLTHTSGLAYGFAAPEPLGRLYAEAGVSDGLIETPSSLAENTRRLAKLPLAHHPGEQWRYGLSTDVLGRVVEVVSGQSLDAFFRERIFKPLGMADTQFFMGEKKIERLAALYRPSQDQSIRRTGNGPQTAGALRYSATFHSEGSKTYFSGGAGLVSTGRDYGRFLQMLLNGGELDGVRLLRPETVAQMTRNQIGKLNAPFRLHGDKFGYGFGVHTEDNERHGASVGSYSWGGIFNTYFWVDPEREVIGVLLTQLYPSGHLSIRTDFKEAVYTALDVPRSVRLIKNAVDENADGLACYKIITPTATYYLEKYGAGLSSMIDKEGNNWLNFHPRPGSGAGGEWRGFPNAVFREAGNYFHARNRATDPSTMRVDRVEPDRVTISALSSNELWACRYDFFPTHCTFTMTRMPEGHKYWVLYEGTPGGEFDLTDWWMTSAIKERQPMKVNFEGHIPAPSWMVFGDARSERVLFMLHHEEDSHPDYFYQMNELMTVFGFGRRGMTKFLDTVPQHFSIGFLETTEHGEISRALNKVLEQDLSQSVEEGQ